MTRSFRYLPLILSIGFGSGCSSNGGWYGYNQPAYPIGAYPGTGYPGGIPPGYPNPYAQPGAFGNPTTANSPPNGAWNQVPGAAAPGVPQYAQPLPNGYPPAGYPGAFPQPQGGVPLNQFAPNQPFFGR